MRGLLLALSALLVACSAPAEPRPRALEPDLSIEWYEYDASGGWLEIRNVSNHTGQPLSVMFQAKCQLQPFDPVESRFHSQDVPVSESGGVGYYLAWDESSVDPKAVGGPMVCRFWAVDSAGTVLRVSAGPSEILLPLPEAPPPAPKPPPEGTPVNPVPRP